MLFNPGKTINLQFMERRQKSLDIYFRRMLPGLFSRQHIIICYHGFSYLPIIVQICFLFVFGRGEEEWKCSFQNIFDSWMRNSDIELKRDNVQFNHFHFLISEFSFLRVFERVVQCLKWNLLIWKCSPCVNKSKTSLWLQRRDKNQDQEYFWTSSLFCAFLYVDGMAHIFVWCGDFFSAVTDDDIVCQREFCTKHNHTKARGFDYFLNFFDSYSLP